MADKDLLVSNETYGRTVKWGKVLLSNINNGVDYLINILNQNKWDELQDDEVFKTTLQIMNEKYKNEVINSIFKDSYLNKKVGAIINSLLDIRVSNDAKLKEIIRTNGDISTSFIKHVILINEYKDLNQYGLVLREIIDYSTADKIWINNLLKKDICARYIYNDLSILIQNTPDILVDLENLGLKLGKYFTKEKIEKVPNLLIQLGALINDNELNSINYSNLPMVLENKSTAIVGKSDKAVIVLDLNVEYLYSSSSNVHLVYKEPIILKKLGDFQLESSDRSLKIKKHVNGSYNNRIGFTNPKSSPYSNLEAISAVFMYKPDDNIFFYDLDGKVYYLNLE